jgi:REP element-mobilizing transposase RayT
MMYEVVIRTIAGRRLLRPTAELTEGVLGILARALQLYEVMLHAFIFLSNHAHLMLSAARGDEVGAFMCHVNRNTATLAKRLNHWPDPVWERYQPTPILDDLASVQRFRYVLLNGVKEGLVASPLDWQGPSSARALVTGEPLAGRWVHRARGVVHAEELLPIELAPLPCWADLDPEVRATRIREICDDVVEYGRVVRDGRSPLGMRAVLAADPREPVELERTPPPRAHASDPIALAAFEAEEEDFADAYRRASAARRMGELATFPPFGYPSAPPFEPGA